MLHLSNIGNWWDVERMERKKTRAKTKMHRRIVEEEDEKVV